MKAFTSILHKVTGSQSPIRWDEHNLTLIGSGSSGPVYLGKDQSGSPIVVKEAHIRELDEVKLLQKLSHKNIVKYLGAETKEETSYILLEYVPDGSISSHLMKGPFDEDKTRTYTQQLLLGLQYLHQKEITHGDIKGANILIDADGCIKLADFGLSKQGAQLWMAPEVLLKKDLHNCRFADKPDIWSVGCTVIEMATGNPWRGNYDAGASFLKHMEKSDSVPPIPDNLSSYGRQFLRRCLQREPNLRASASQLLEDPFITRQNFPKPPSAPAPKPRPAPAPKPHKPPSAPAPKPRKPPSAPAPRPPSAPSPKPRPAPPPKPPSAPSPRPPSAPSPKPRPAPAPKPPSAPAPRPPSAPAPKPHKPRPAPSPKPPSAPAPKHPLVTTSTQHVHSVASPVHQATRPPVHSRSSPSQHVMKHKALQKSRSDFTPFNSEDQDAIGCNRLHHQGYGSDWHEETLAVSKSTLTASFFEPKFQSMVKYDWESI